VTGLLTVFNRVAHSNLCHESASGEYRRPALRLRHWPLLITLFSNSPNAFQLFLSELVLLPRGHHSTLPLPRNRVPSFLPPLFTVNSKLLPLFNFVSSDETGKKAVTLVTLRRFALGINRSPHLSSCSQLHRLFYYRAREARDAGDRSSVARRRPLRTRPSN
jgi:hypothetical protein